MNNTLLALLVYIAISFGILFFSLDKSSLGIILGLLNLVIASWVFLFFWKIFWSTKNKTTSEFTISSSAKTSALSRVYMYLFPLSLVRVLRNTWEMVLGIWSLIPWIVSLWCAWICYRMSESSLKTWWFVFGTTRIDWSLLASCLGIWVSLLIWKYLFVSWDTSFWGVFMSLVWWSVVYWLSFNFWSSNNNFRKAILTQVWWLSLIAAFARWWYQTFMHRADTHTLQKIKIEKPELYDPDLFLDASEPDQLILSWTNLSGATNISWLLLDLDLEKIIDSDDNPESPISWIDWWESPKEILDAL